MPALQSYATVLQATEILDRYGTPQQWADGTNDQRIRWLNVGTRFVDDIYGPKAKGCKASASQALLWPRTKVYAHGFEVAVYDETQDPPVAIIPEAIMVASVLAASRAAQGVDLFPANTGSSAAVKREKDEIGPLKTETEWVEGASSGEPPRLSDVDSILRASDLFDLGGGARELRRS